MCSGLTRLKKPYGHCFHCSLWLSSINTVAIVVIYGYFPVNKFSDWVPFLNIIFTTTTTDYYWKHIKAFKANNGFMQLQNYFGKQMASEFFLLWGKSHYIPMLLAIYKYGIHMLIFFNRAETHTLYLKHYQIFW